MIIKQIELDNFRIYKGHHLIDLSPQAGKNIYVVSGRNGFGKTTFLMSLVWCLYGRQMQEVDDLYKREIEDQGGYPKYIGNSLNRQAKEEEVRSFSVKLVIADAIIPELTCGEISIKRTFDTFSGDENLEILIDGSDNELIKELGDDKMRGEENFIRDYLLPIEIAKFFFFDAEKIVSLAEVNTQDQRRKLSKAYSEILGIKKYEDAKTEIEDTRFRLRKRTANEKEEAQLNTIEADIKNARLLIAQCEEEVDSLHDERVEKKYAADELQTRLVRIGNLISIDELEELRARGRELENRMKELQDELAQSYDIVPFAIAANTLAQVADQAKTEAEFKDSKFKQENVDITTEAVLNDLIEEQKECPAAITHGVQKFYFDTISKLIRKHFFADAPAFPADFRLIHDFTESERSGLQGLLSNLRLSFREQFRSFIFRYDQTRTEQAKVRRLINEAESIAEDEVVKADRDKRNALDKEIEAIDRKIGALIAQIEQARAEILQKDKQSKELSKRLTVSRDDRAKDKLSEELVKRLRSYIKLYKERKKESLEEQILSGLQMLMHKTGFVQRVEVDLAGEDIDIHLYGRDKKRIPKESLSKGEQQLYATALLYGLVEESDIKFPIFIDSPMQKFDDSHAGNIVKHFYPSIADQVILFPLINKELSESEYQVLLPNVARSYLIVNHDSNRSDFREVPPAELFQQHNAMSEN